MRIRALLIALSLAAAPAWAGKSFDTREATSAQLLDYLQHGDWRFRKDAVDELGDRKVRDAAEPLKGVAAQDASEEVRRAALKALRRIDPQLGVPAAETTLLEDPFPENRREALAVIEDAASARSAPVLAAVIRSDPDEGVRLKSMKIIAKRGWRGAEDALRSAVEDPASSIRVTALETLLKLGGVKDRALAHDALARDPDIGVRRNLVEAIEEAPTPDDKDALVAALADPDEDVARHAARALARLGDRSVIPALQDAAKAARDRKVEKEIRETIDRLGG